jgi:hypothetical protein
VQRSMEGNRAPMQIHDTEKARLSTHHRHTIGSSAPSRHTDRIVSTVELSDCQHHQIVGPQHRHAIGTSEPSRHTIGS